MSKFSKPFFGAAGGEIYPRWFQPGEDCPPDLMDAAREASALEAQATKAAKRAPERK
jgi:hypothetical protein